MKLWSKEDVKKLEFYLSKNLTLEAIGRKIERSTISVFKKASSLGYEKQWVKSTENEKKIRKHNNKLENCFETILK